MCAGESELREPVSDLRNQAQTRKEHADEEKNECFSHKSALMCTTLHLGISHANRDGNAHNLKDSEKEGDLSLVERSAQATAKST